MNNVASVAIVAAGDDQSEHQMHPGATITRPTGTVHSDWETTHSDWETTAVIIAGPRIGKTMSLVIARGAE